MSLTSQEIECAKVSQFDLASGYPQVRLPRYFAEAIGRLNHLRELTTNHFGTATSNRDEVRDRLCDSACRFLGEGPGLRLFRTHLTYSGSAAISRALVACKNVGKARNRAGLELVLLSPCIDIYGMFAEELAGVAIQRIDCVEPHFVPNVPAVLAVARSPAPDNMQRVFLIASPENPTGYVWRRGDLQALVAACEEHSHCLILDHAFLLAGLQIRRPAALWDLQVERLFGCALWDTGKTFGMNGEKIGMIFSTPIMSRHIDDALSVLHFSVSSFQQALFADVLHQASDNSYQDELREIAHANLAKLSSALTEFGCETNEPHGGTFALVDVGKVFASDEVARESLLRHRIGVVSASAFFHHVVVPKTWIRVALARDKSSFSEAVADMSYIMRRSRA